MELMNLKKEDKQRDLNIKSLFSFHYIRSCEHIDLKVNLICMKPANLR